MASRTSGSRALASHRARQSASATTTSTSSAACVSRHRTKSHSIASAMTASAVQRVRLNVRAVGTTSAASAASASRPTTRSACATPASRATRVSTRVLASFRRSTRTARCGSIIWCKLFSTKQLNRARGCSLLFLFFLLQVCSDYGECLVKEDGNGAICKCRASANRYGSFCQFEQGKEPIIQGERGCDDCTAEHEYCDPVEQACVCDDGCDNAFLITLFF